MLMVQANVTVPKFALITHASNGAGHYAMNSMAWDPRFLFSWPNARVSVMGGEQAAKTLGQVKLAALKREGKTPGADEVAAIMRETAADYDAKSDAYYATSELWDDGILDPVDTRNALGIALSFSLRLYLPSKIGFFRQHKLAAAVVGIVAATGISFSMSRWVVFSRRSTRCDHSPLGRPDAAALAER